MVEIKTEHGTFTGETARAALAAARKGEKQAAKEADERHAEYDRATLEARALGLSLFTQLAEVARDERPRVIWEYVPRIADGARFLFSAECRNGAWVARIYTDAGLHVTTMCTEPIGVLTSQTSASRFIVTADREIYAIGAYKRAFTWERVLVTSDQFDLLTKEAQS